MCPADSCQQEAYIEMINILYDEWNLTVHFDTIEHNNHFHVGSTAGLLCVHNSSEESLCENPAEQNKWRHPHCWK